MKNQVIKIDEKFIHAALGQDSCDITIVDLVSLANITFTREFIDTHQHCFSVIIDESYELSQIKELVDKLIFALTQPKYLCYQTYPILFVHNTIKDNIKNRIKNELIDFGFTGVQFKQIVEQDENDILLWDVKNYYPNTSKYDLLTNLDLLNAKFMLSNNLSIKAALKEIKKNRSLDLSILAESKKLLAMNEDLLVNYSWEKKQLYYHKQYLKIIKSDRSLLLFSKMEAVVKKNFWVKKLAKSAINKLW